MRFPSLSRHDAWRAIPQTLCMRGLGLVFLACCGLIWPELALTITLVDIGIICLLFAIADLFVAWAVKQESSSSARKIGALGLLGLSFGGLVLTLVAMPLQVMRAAALLWLVASGVAITLVGSTSSRRARASSIIPAFGAFQLVLAFLFLMAHPLRAEMVLHASVSYAASLGGAQVLLGLTLRRARPSRERLTVTA
jgi:hypothetical protein